MSIIYKQTICPHCNNVYTKYHGGEGLVCPHCNGDVSDISPIEHISNEQQTTSSNRKCPKCGNNLLVHLGANVSCTTCGYAENDLMYRGSGVAPSITEPITPFYTPPVTPQYQPPVIDDNPNYYNFDNTGWICPKCGRGVSPLVSVCPCHHQDVSITSNPITSSQFNQNNITANDNINKVLKI